MDVTKDLVRGEKIVEEKDIYNMIDDWGRGIFDEDHWGVRI